VLFFASTCLVPLHVHVGRAEKYLGARVSMTRRVRIRVRVGVGRPRENKMLETGWRISGSGAGGESKHLAREMRPASQKS
jgi:hypothetical protein